MFQLLGFESEREEWNTKTTNLESLNAKLTQELDCLQTEIRNSYRSFKEKDLALSIAESDLKAKDEVRLFEILFNNLLNNYPKSKTFVHWILITRDNEIWTLISVELQSAVVLIHICI